MGNFQQIQKENVNHSQTFIQPVLEVGKEDDGHEQEANRVADKVMRMGDMKATSSRLQRMGDMEDKRIGNMKPGPDILPKMHPDDEEEKLQKKPDAPVISKMTDVSGGGVIAPESVEQGISSSKGNGQSLPGDLQQELGEKMNADLGGVKVHTDEKAAQMNKEIGAKAFTHGNDIYFNKGQYNPGSSQGKYLLAHELTHTVQQGKGVKRKIQRMNDTMYENGMGLTTAIVLGNMKPVDDVNGKEFPVKGCLGKEDCEVKFTFGRAFIGNYTYKLQKQVYPYTFDYYDVKGIYVKITGDLTDKAKYPVEKLKLLQIVTAYTKGAEENAKETPLEPDNDERKKRTGWDDPDAKSKGTMIDSNDRDLNASPFYTSYQIGEEGDNTRSAKLWDAPATNLKNAIITNVGKKFQTYLMAEIDGRNVMLARVDWGYFIDNSGTAIFSPSPVASLVASTEMKDAVERWDKVDAYKKTNIADVMKVTPQSSDQSTDLLTDPDKPGDVLEKVPAGSQVMIKSKGEDKDFNKKANQQYQWWQVRVLNGIQAGTNEGWVKSTDLKNL